MLAIVSRIRSFELLEKPDEKIVLPDCIIGISC
jgi:hypothetical protein